MDNIHPYGYETIKHYLGWFWAPTSLWQTAVKKEAARLGWLQRSHARYLLYRGTGDKV